jgi:hypothetical protein
VQENCQLASYRDDGASLSALPATLRQLNPAASLVAVLSKRTQDMLRGLYQQCSKVRVAFPGDMQLWLTLPGISSPWLQSHIAVHVTALAKVARVFQGQYVGKRNQSSYTLYLLQECHFLILVLGQVFNLCAVFANTR